MAIALERYGLPVQITKQVQSFPDFGSHWIYELIRTIVWIKEALFVKVPHRYRAWFRFGANGFRIGPLSGFDIPHVMIEAIIGEDVADPLDGRVEDPSSPEVNESEVRSVNKSG